ncbi:hypothetical protein Glove_87g79 [Diversispora epigaea]|uniref:Protein kinase domain-containing protein n=1 Tax=Diversispora epigaea TaxID=1348612 RepID=A0A397JAC5_9GLOM|nr:hypothetical protein Glove_87g79 [Diversispora epigaea]
MLEQGGFGRIYNAKWIDGYILYWDIKNSKNGQDMNNKYNKKIKIYSRTAEASISFYGITKDPEVLESYEELCNNELEELSANHSTTTTSLNFKTHPQAIYTIRLLNFSNLSKPVL